MFQKLLEEFSMLKSIELAQIIIYRSSNAYKNIILPWLAFTKINEYFLWRPNQLETPASEDLTMAF